MLAAAVLLGDYRQAPQPAKIIRHPAHLGICGLIGVEPLAIHAGYGIEDKMVVQDAGVQMGGDYHLKAVAPESVCQLHADLMCLFRGDLPRLEGLVAME